MTPRLSQKITISPEVLSQEVSDEIVLLDLSSEGYFGLDAVGARIWQLMQEHTDIQTVFDTMLTEYDVDAERLEKDLNDLLKKLSDAGLIVLEPVKQDEHPA